MNEVMKSAGGMKKKSQQHNEKVRKMGKNARNMEEKVKKESRILGRRERFRNEGNEKFRNQIKKKCNRNINH